MLRIKAVTAGQSATLIIEWDDGTSSNVNLIGWIATGGELLVPLNSADTWKTARVEDFGATVEWDGDDLAIDAIHLRQIADDQQDFGVEDLRQWQKNTGLSNNEAADFLGVSPRTWKNYRAGAPVSNAIKMLLRASLRDPLLMHSHYRPRQNGRPRTAA